MNIYNNNQSHIKQENFIWVAEYDKEINKRLFLPEWEFENNGCGFVRNSHDDINKEALSFLGFIGHGYSFNYNTLNGIFNLYNSKIEFKFFDEINNEEIILMDEKYKKYNDYIVYRTMATDFDLGGHQSTILLEYGVGYKKQIDKNLNVTAIFHIPMEVGKKTFISYKMVSKKDIKGNFNMYINDKQQLSLKSQLNKNFGKEFKITIN